MTHRRKKHALGTVGSVGLLFCLAGLAHLAHQVETPDEGDGNQYAEQSADLQNLAPVIAPEVRPSLGEARLPAVEDFRHFFRSDRQLGLLQDAPQLRLVPRHADADRDGEVIEDTDDLDPVVEMLGGQIATGIVAADGGLALAGVYAAHGGEEGRIDLELDLRVFASNEVVEKIANRRRQSLARQVREAMDTPHPFIPATLAGAHQHRGAA